MVKVDQDKCIGCGLCTSICEEVFKIGKKGKAEVISQKNSDCIEEAIESCPVNAISK